MFGADFNQDSNLSKISQQRTWLKLLYYDEKNQESDVIANDYFLSTQGRHDPLEELKATIEAYYKPFGIDPNTHAMCQFPARYSWLSRKLELKGYQPVNPKCVNLRKSISDQSVDSISLMFVGGYLSNPASSFGHSFIKLNNHEQTKNNLFDLSISYGADVPENENMFAYMYKGLFGKYTAAFKDKYFFTQDLVYSNNEFRDIWEYELDIPKEKVSMFQFHLWEILGKNFTYLFLNKNCGYEVAKMLEIILDQDIAESSKVWFAPVESINTLAKIDSQNGIIKQRIYHPSEQKKVYKKYQELSEAEKVTSAYLIEKGMEDSNQTYKTLNTTEKTNVINFVIMYYNYLLIKDNSIQEYERLKKKALIERFSLPIQRETELKFPDVLAPDYNDKPIIFSISHNTSKKESGYYSMGFTPYAITSTGNNNLEGDELAVLNTEIGFSEEKLFLKDFNLISIKQFNRYSIPFEDEMKLSWQLEISTKNVDIKNERYDTFIKAGIGNSWMPTDNLLIYAMLDASGHSHYQSLIVSPEIGMRLDIGVAKVMAAFEDGYDLAKMRRYHATKITSNINIGKDMALFLQYEDQKDECNKLMAGMRFFF
ncbi:MAG: DUF4105 domain-containing protein [Sulfuricurvum sp.]|nr:DUF4105 domain-containing protein [Sulfuricurvum sp.]